MSLAEWQRELVARITAPGGARTGPAPAAHDCPGVALTRMLQRNWRYTRLTHALPLTMRVLPATARDELLAGYCDTCPCVSFFPVHEARSFAGYLARLPAPPPHVASIAALEVAMIDALEADVFGDAARPRPDAGGALRLARGASRVRFAAPPEQVLAAALAGRSLPAADAADHELLVAPGISGLARPPTAEERRLLDACERGAADQASPLTAAVLLTEQVLARAS